MSANPTPEPEREETQEPLGEFTRRKMKIQLGDGPDQRGEVTVEMVRAADNEDAGFADWHQETDRAARVLRDRLGLDAEPAPADD